MYETQNYAASLIAAKDVACQEFRGPTVSESISQQLTQANANVKRLTELKELIERNPDIERILTLMNR